MCSTPSRPLRRLILAVPSDEWHEYRRLYNAYFLRDVFAAEFELCVCVCVCVIQHRLTARCYCSKYAIKGSLKAIVSHPAVDALTVYRTILVGARLRFVGKRRGRNTKGWPGWVGCMHGWLYSQTVYLPEGRMSPIPLLTVLNVGQFRRSRPTRYHQDKPPPDRREHKLRRFRRLEAATDVSSAA